MKTSLITFLAIASAFTCQADNMFTIGTNTISVIFQTNAILQPDRDFISSDLEKVFAFAKNLEAAFSTTSVPTKLELEWYPAPQPFPDGLRRQLSVSHQDGAVIIMPKDELISKYLDAKIFAQTNTILLEQFDNIVTAFNSGSVTNLSIAAKKEIFWTPKSGDVSDVKMSEIIQTVSSDAVLHYPSVLNYDTDLPLGYDDDDTADVFAFIAVTRRTTGEFATTYCVVRIDNKIKLFVF